MYFILLLIDYEALIREDGANVIFLLLTTNKEDLVLSLNGSEVLWKQVSISQGDLHCCLSIQLMDEK